jgi:dolichol-phosphate mannosyltransferase
MQSMSEPHTAVVIPCFKVQGKVIGVIARIGPEVKRIYVVDDACPERTGDLVKREVSDPRVEVITHQVNRGVGAATLTGMEKAVANGAEIVIKLDGDGQMDPALIPNFVKPIVNGEADYTKGNRFFSPEYLRGMPKLRVFGNGMLSFLSKLSSGYWSVFDPTNGYIAIHASVFELIAKDKVASRFFFESDLLFRLNLIRANVVDIPIRASYGDERSTLRAGAVLMPFFVGHLRNFFKRIVYSYLVRDFSIGSLYLLFGFPIFLFGVIFGITEWIAHGRSGQLASAGTVMLAALPIIVGFQLLLAFFAYDIANVPRSAIHPKISNIANTRPLG